MFLVKINKALICLLHLVAISYRILHLSALDFKRGTSSQELEDGEPVFSEPESMLGDADGLEGLSNPSTCMTTKDKHESSIGMVYE